jgi:hypothetical protein
MIPMGVNPPYYIRLAALSWQTTTGIEIMIGSRTLAKDGE